MAGHKTCVKLGRDKTEFIIRTLFLLCQGATELKVPLVKTKHPSEKFGLYLGGKFGKLEK